MGAGVVVIVNQENKVDSFNHRQIIDIYMGRNLYFPNGSRVIRLDQPPDSIIRSKFYQALLGKTVAQVNAYWARLLFTGRGRPPHTLESTRQVLEAVRDNINAIGYIDESSLDDSVKVVGHVD
ncbi:MAG: hypothetical protein CSA50_02885 [Gammaproteobacteria bacterium]|nr:MAG: hypothetical protein CSA50_02885 [Gammaproteobacteria bacterium]